ncbi:hypothetical protein [Parendozoicomonas haliclonae]|uniref:Uncharacterized protein n=1 Tax=Parendozoicomonas haliclonae TaxID=1960125 RepID=A0A1X7ANW7_9GAMM|nr:hypothetical protein [Parendozoicomonas haliclonae]SMA49822.1 hypothetical protein EHSB41UT_03611 [Parendozoicomonas haliclonae]
MSIGAVVSDSAGYLGRGLVKCAKINTAVSFGIFTVSATMALTPFTLVVDTLFTDPDAKHEDGHDKYPVSEAMYKLSGRAVKELCDYTVETYNS